MSEEYRRVLSPVTLTLEEIYQQRKTHSEIAPWYYEQHNECPDCHRHDDFLQSLIGATFLDKETAKDRNSCQCQSCGWSGCVHDLLPATRPEVIEKLRRPKTIMFTDCEWNRANPPACIEIGEEMLLSEYNRRCFENLVKIRDASR